MDSQDLATSQKKADNGRALSRSAQRANEAAQRKAAQQQKILLILLGVALLINIAVAYVLYNRMIVDKQAENLVRLTQQEVDNRTSILTRYIKQETQRINKLASEAELLNSLDATNSENNEDHRRFLERKWLLDTPATLDLRIFPLGTASLEREAEFPIRFAELDLIRRAEQGEQPLPELMSLNDRWMLNWARPLTADAAQPPAGTLLIRTDATELITIFSGSNADFGEYLLAQQFAGSPAQTIIKLGAGNAAPSKQANVPGSYLQLTFTPSEKLIASATEEPTFWILVTSLIAVGSLVAVWLLGKLMTRADIGAQQPTTAPSDIDVAQIAKVALSTEENVPSPLFQKQDILDIAVIEEDENILGLGQAAGKKISGAARNKINEADVPAEIFRSYDIRGLVGSQITPELATSIGQAVGSEAIDQGEQSIIVARDGRTHSELLTKALIKGILRSGCNVINIGIVPTPLMYFATFHFTDSHSGVMVTASHNPKEYNGFKVVMNNNALSDDSVMDLRSRILTQRLHQGVGEEMPREIIADYIDRIFSDVALAGNISIVVDAGNAVTGLVAPKLFEELGCDVTPLFCELDGEFPNHDPDPTMEKNLTALIAKVQEVNADIGVAFDGDGDRLVVVTPKGDIIWPDRLLMLFAKDILARNPGADVLFDVKCSRQLNQVISSYGGRPIMWKTGHSPMKAKMLETDALIGGEYSGHIFIKDRWYGFDDGIYAMARLLEIITLRDQKIDDIFAGFPQLVSTPEIKVAITEQDKFGFIKKLVEQSEFQGGALTTIDGLRVDYTKGWGLVRASNTSAALTLRFEAESQEALEKIQQIFKRELLKIDKNLSLNF